MNFKHLVMLALSIGFFSCVKNSSRPAIEQPDDPAVVESFYTVEPFKVPIKSGYVTNVTMNGVLLASTSTPVTIMVPKANINTKADDCKGIIVYYQEGNKTETFSTLWQTVLFEDSKQGDYDYNDLIFHTNYTVNGNKLNVQIHPIALGAAKTIALGYKWTNGTASGEVIVSQDCRKDLFNTDDIFTNTFMYNTHYNNYVCPSDVTLPNPSEAVSIDWFIVVDKSTKIFAVNQTGEKCLDNNSMPYGFALTDTGVGQMPQQETKVIKKASVATKAAAEWSDIESKWQWPSINESDYVGLSNMASYQAWNANGNYYVRAGETYTGDIIQKNNNYYVSGKLVITNYWGTSANIYVLDGGCLEFSTSNTIQKFNIYCYPGSSIKVKDDVLDLGYNSNLMVAYDVAFDKVKMTSSKLFLGNRIDVKEFHMDNTSEAYVSCCAYVANKVYITNNSTLDLNNYLIVPELKLDSKSSINIRSNGLMEVEDVYHSANSTTRINVIGDEYAVLKVKNYRLDAYSHGTNEPFDISERFIGNLDLHYTQLVDNNGVYKGAELITSSQAIINGPTYLPQTTCRPAFGEPTQESGNCWFSYPLENVNINTCYRFSEWAKGNFDFTPLPGAKLFDIFSTAPAKGLNLGVFEMMN